MILNDILMILDILMIPSLGIETNLDVKGHNKLVQEIRHRRKNLEEDVYRQ